MSFDSIDHIAELLVHLGRAARTEDAQGDLTAAQWTCLRFFARANDSTCTPSAFASFQATTRGTASQIIKSLERRGLIARRRSPTDGRSVRFGLTGAGHAMLSKDPLGNLNDLLGAMELTERDALLATLSRLASSLADLKNARSFGTCRNCIHFTPSRDSGFCACMAAALGAEDISKLCGSYRSPAASAAGFQRQGQINDPG